MDWRGYVWFTLYLSHCNEIDSHDKTSILFLCQTDSVNKVKYNKWEWFNLLSLMVFNESVLSLNLMLWVWLLLKALLLLFTRTSRMFVLIHQSHQCLVLQIHTCYLILPHTFSSVRIAKMLPTTENTRLGGLYVSEPYGLVESIRVINIGENTIILIALNTYSITKQYIRQLWCLHQCNGMAHKELYEWFMNDNSLLIQ